MIKLNEKQKERYNRQIILAEIGEEGQGKLLKTKVLVVGAGGLGTPILQYLVAAGVGELGIIDDDKVSLSNLQRQILYNESQIGESKVEKSKEWLVKLNSDTKIEVFDFVLEPSNAEDIISKYDIIVGATDNFSSRMLIDEITKKQKKPFVHGSIGEFEGQVSVFNFEDGASYKDLFPEVPDGTKISQGVIGALPGIIGALQAMEVLKIILGIGDVLSGKLLVYNALNCNMNIFRFK